MPTLNTGVLVDPSSTETQSVSASVVLSMRNLISATFAPFSREYRQWPWSQIGTIIVVCFGSYSLYRWLPEPYRRYYMSSTRNFSRRYNQALHHRKQQLFDELKNVQTKEVGKRLQVIEIGAAHGANMIYYPPNREICHYPLIFYQIIS